ncbi:MAG: 4Fe-4S binding protein, partial [Desulfobacterales bacterium]|nr:4Fe-4S binding protein [Desulfobacterales bacterium]
MPAPTGQIINIQHFSLHDGPGIRTTLFFKGCPLKCAWCANPDTQKKGRELIHSRNQCTGCGQCIQACPDNLIAFTEDKADLAIDRENCTLCTACVEACPGNAMRIAGREVQLGEVMEEIEKEKHFYRNSEGGVT